MKRKMNAMARVIGLLAILAAALVAVALFNAPLNGRLKLPVGRGLPAISLGERHGLILASDGSLWSWGSDFLGWPMLGMGTRTDRSMSLRRIGGETNWASISAGESHSIGIKSDGTLWTWGESVEARFTGSHPIPSPVQVAAGNDWKTAAAGGIHSIAIKKDGTLWGWGNNWAGSVGIPAPNGSSTPVQIGAEANWVKVWASTLESVALQSNGSLWYWGDNLDPALPQGGGQPPGPTRVGSDTNWAEVGFGPNTVFAIKSDGTLWAWGRHAHVYTDAINEARNIIPEQVGTNSDWSSISVCAGWWRTGLIKKDGSLWVMDASQGKSNGPEPPYQPVRFQRVEFQKDCVAYAAGAVHGAEPGVHGPINVLMTRDGEVWTWGMVMGDPPNWKNRFQDLVSNLARYVHLKIPTSEPRPIYRDDPWQLRNAEPGIPAK
jgi:alpha-tubulin suppressor-like RCC1 family protein